jgi:hypothetical protein
LDCRQGRTQRHEDTKRCLAGGLKDGPQILLPFPFALCLCGFVSFVFAVAGNPKSPAGADEAQGVVRVLLARLIAQAWEIVERRERGRGSAKAGIDERRGRRRGLRRVERLQAAGAQEEAVIPR